MGSVKASQDLIPSLKKSTSAQTFEMVYRCLAGLVGGKAETVDVEEGLRGAREQHDRFAHQGCSCDMKSNFTTSKGITFLRKT